MVPVRGPVKKRIRIPVSKAIDQRFEVSRTGPERIRTEADAIDALLDKLIASKSA